MAKAPDLLMIPEPTLKAWDVAPVRLQSSQVSRFARQLRRRRQPEPTSDETNADDDGYEPQAEAIPTSPTAFIDALERLRITAPRPITESVERRKARALQAYDETTEFFRWVGR